MSIAEDITTAIQNVIGKQSAELHKPCFFGNESKYIQQCIDSTFVSSVGKFVDLFEADLAKFTGAKHAIAVVNGTCALQVALQLAEVGFNEEVLIPALSFVATANASFTTCFALYEPCGGVSLTDEPCNGSSHSIRTSKAISRIR